MKKETLYVAFSTQKGGVGKTTFTVLVASYLFYLKGYNVAVVDCDYPQHSISAMRKRDAEQVNGDDYYKQLAFLHLFLLCAADWQSCPAAIRINIPKTFVNFIITLRSLIRKKNLLPQSFNSTIFIQYSAPVRVFSLSRLSFPALSSLFLCHLPWSRWYSLPCSSPVQGSRASCHPADCCLKVYF